jgi:DNA-binding NarL/FixJ family response regulator
MSVRRLPTRRVVSIVLGGLGGLIAKGATVDKHIGVCNAPPVYVAGLVETLSDLAYSVSTVTDATEWATGGPDRILMLMVNQPEDYDLVVDLRAKSPESVLITLLEPVSADAVASSLRAGATGAVGLFSSSEEVALAIEAASGAKVVIPTEMARSMMKSSLSNVDPRMLSAVDIECLRRLAAGEKVASLAVRFNYSEREMYRRLKRLYNRMAVAGRTEALLLAARWGLID